MSLKTYLDSLLEIPRLYGISNHFTNLRTEIDVCFTARLIQSANHDSIKENWALLIATIDKFEKECFKSFKQNQFNEHITNESIQIISSEDEDLIYKQIVKLESVLFLNKTVFFLDKSKCNEDLLQIFSLMDPNTTVGLLLFIKNEYFGTKGTDLIKK